MMSAHRRYVQRGLDELRRKSLHAVQTETALVWAGRACAAMRLGRPDEAHEYGHEAVEHAALTGNDALLRDVRDLMLTFGVRV